MFLLCFLYSYLNMFCDIIKFVYYYTMFMDKKIEEAKKWFREQIVKSHVENTKKLIRANEFKINPFLISYLANFLTGNSSPESIAKVLIYPRILATSISTSFGTRAQSLFTDEGIGSYGSAIEGIDIEFFDSVDCRKKYCQLKAGPQTINKDDVETIHGHFKKLRGIAKTNNLAIDVNDLIIGVLYGSQDDLSANYKALANEHHYPVFVGEEFWYRLTGDKNFYHKLIIALSEVAEEFDSTGLIEDTIKALAQDDEIKRISNSIDKENR